MKLIKMMRKEAEAISKSVLNQATFGFEKKAIKGQLIL